MLIGKCYNFLFVIIVVLKDDVHVFICHIHIGGNLFNILLLVLTNMCCRSIKGICGFTRELIVGLIANIESRKEYIKRGLPPERPRASSTDDVEGFVALLHEMFGLVFDLKQFYEVSTKILNEFTKRIDPNLAFYYWTGVKERYRDFELPSFDNPTGPEIVERLDKIKLSRRGDPGVFVANRASLPQRGQLTARAKFHKAPIALPPSQVPCQSRDDNSPSLI